MVGDGDAQNPYLLLWRSKDGKFEGPKPWCGIEARSTRSAFTFNYDHLTR